MELLSLKPGWVEWPRSLAAPVGGRAWRERNACEHTRDLLCASAAPHQTESIKREMAQLAPGINFPTLFGLRQLPHERQRTLRHPWTQRLAPSLRP